MLARFVLALSPGLFLLRTIHAQATSSNPAPSVKLSGYIQGRETYQDDIILDETKPTISVLSGTTTQRVAPSRLQLNDLLAKRAVKVKIRATDKTSGIGAMQVTTKKKKPGRWRDYTSKFRFRMAGDVLFVRVRDRAGNVSRWSKLTIPR